MKIKSLLIAFVTSALCVGCGQTTSNTPITPENQNMANISNNTVSNVNQNATTNTLDTDEGYGPYNPSEYHVLTLPIDDNNTVPVGTYTDDTKQLMAVVELPNDTNTQNLDIILEPTDYVDVLNLTDSAGFWKIRIHSTGYYPIQVTVEDFNIGEGKYGLIKRISANRVTTLYNTEPWPAGPYRFQIIYGEGKAFASIQTGSSLAELGITTSNFNN